MRITHYGWAGNSRPPCGTANGTVSTRFAEVTCHECLSARVHELEVALDQWGHDRDCARVRARVLGVPPVLCDCTIEDMEIEVLERDGANTWRSRADTAEAR